MPDMQGVRFVCVFCVCVVCARVHACARSFACVFGVVAGVSVLMSSHCVCLSACVCVPLFVFVRSRACLRNLGVRIFGVRIVVLSHGLSVLLQKPATLTAATVAELPLDAARIEGVARYRALTAAAGVEGAESQKCELCVRRNPGSKFCEVCCKFACAKCAEDHPFMTESAGHTMRPVAGAAAGDGSFRRHVRCPDPDHAHEALCMFCNCCRKAACLKCAVSKHSGHGVVDAAKAVIGMKEALLAAVGAVGFDAAQEITFKAALA